MSKFQELINGDTPVLVDFFAEWCGPCKMMPPILKEVKDKLGDQVRIIKIDIDKNPQVARQYTVQAVPTMIIFKNGKIIWRNAGVTPAQQIMKQLQA
jgi:thioredoxin 1